MKRESNILIGYDYHQILMPCVLNHLKYLKYLTKLYSPRKLKKSCLWFEEQATNCQKKEKSSYGSYDDHCNGVAENTGRVRSHVEGELISWFLLLWGAHYVSMHLCSVSYFHSFLFCIISWEHCLHCTSWQLLGRKRSPPMAPTARLRILVE